MLFRSELQQLADNRISIMPGSGVRVDTIETLARQTGCTEFHSSLREVLISRMEFKHPSFKESKESYQNPSIDSKAIGQLKERLVLVKKN